MSAVQCELCPKGCIIKPGQSGDCRIRVNIDGELHAVTYGYPCSLHIDPVEKKPMFHFYPGSRAFSVATVGCNLHCRNCQNWEISQAFPNQIPAYHVPPAMLAKLAKSKRCKSVAYTYTDPAVFYEYAFDSCVEAHKLGLKNILVTAGYFNKGPLRELCKHVDGANIDLKAFSDKFYREVCGATLKPVLDSLAEAKKCGVMVEVTNLLIPTLNDDEKMIRALCKWVKANMGKETPVHFSRFFPNYRMRNLPPTSLKKLDLAKKIAQAEGLQYIYIGNVMDEAAESTYCPKCREMLIKRRRYRILLNKIYNNKCPNCKTEIYGKWQ